MNLLPCPFCGAKNPLFNVVTPPPNWYIRCRSAKCAARLEAGTALAVMKRWNLRPAVTPAALPDPSDPSDPSDQSALPQ